MAWPRFCRIMPARRRALALRDIGAPSIFSKCVSSTWYSFTMSSARPTVPAKATAVWSSAGCTFSRSRWAMRLPIVALRSPAIRTPSR